MEALKENLSDLLEWNDGVGFLPLSTENYASYPEFQQGREKEKDAIHRNIVRERIKMIEQFTLCDELSKCLDVYIGGGFFIREMNRITKIKTCGIDVSVYALKWLKSNEYESVQNTYDLLTFWDAFDQIPEPDRYIVDYKPRYVAISIPIYYSKEQIVSSYYFNSGKRFWFFTEKGLVKWMNDLDFSMICHSNQEDVKFGKTKYQTFIFAANTKYEAIYG